MRAFLRKLHGNTGAAMVLALLFLLFCTTIGMLTLSAASVNVGKLNRMRLEQQSYLAVRSAAMAFEDLVESLEYSGSYTYYEKQWQEEEVGGEGGSFIKKYTEKRYSNKTGSFSHSGFQTLVGDKINALFYYTLGDLSAGPIPPASYDFQLNLQTGISEYPVVRADVQFSTDEADRYSIKVLLSDLTDGSNPMTLTFQAKPLESTGTLGEAKYNEGDIILEETYQYTYSIRWEPGVLERGVS